MGAKKQTQLQTHFFATVCNQCSYIMLGTDARRTDAQPYVSLFDLEHIVQ